ncbi:hypothetical protein HQO87_26330, partial [Rhodococcus fascians]|nr:hypothetical protein [Rhodococcus fascians]
DNTTPAESNAEISSTETPGSTAAVAEVGSTTGPTGSAAVGSTGAPTTVVNADGSVTQIDPATGAPVAGAPVAGAPAAVPGQNGAATVPTIPSIAAPTVPNYQPPAVQVPQAPQAPQLPSGQLPNVQAPTFTNPLPNTANTVDKTLDGVLNLPGQILPLG